MDEEIIRSTVSIPMSDFRRAVLGGDTVDEARREDRCIQEPTGCGRLLSETIKVEERLGYTWFRDPTSNSEYKITGMCQACQDKVFSPPSQEEFDEAAAFEAEDDFNRQPSDYGFIQNQGEDYL